jgi:hypothetical protein
MKLLIAVGAIVLLASCQSTGIKNEIKARQISEDFTWVHQGDTATDADHTYVLIAPPNDPNSWEKHDSIYIVARTWGQAWAKGATDGSRILFFIGLIGTIGGLAWSIYKFQQGTKDPNDKSVLAWVLIPLIFFALMGISFSWDKWNSDREITKKEYISSPNLDQYWTTEPKHY